MATNNACNYAPVQYNTLTGGANGTINNVSPGTAGQVLTSNGASAQPTFEDAGGGGGGIPFFLQMRGNLSQDSFSYFLIPAIFTTVTTYANNKTIIPIDGTITQCMGLIGVDGTLASSENSTLEIYVNGVSQATVSSTILFDSASSSFSNTGLSVAVNAGDYVQLVLTTGAFTTNPTTVKISITTLVS